MPILHHDPGEGPGGSPDEAPLSPRARPPLASAAQLSAVLAGVADGVTAQDATGRLVYANPAAARLTGYPTPEAMLAADPREIQRRFELRDAEGRPLGFPELPGRRALRGETPEAMTVCWRDRRTGTERWSVLRALPVFDAGGRVELAVNLFHDVTGEVRQQRRLAETAAELEATVAAQRRALAALRESEARFRLLADTAPVLVWMAGADGGCIFVSRPWVEHTGRAAEEELGEGWWEGVHPEDRERCLTVFRDALARREPFRMELRLRRADGEFRWMLNTGVPRYGGAGEFAGFVGSAVDLTERKRAERAHDFLLEASALLAGSLDYERTLAVLARLAVPQMADWCAVDVVQQDGAVRRLAVAHQDPERVAWAREIQERVPYDPDAPAGVAAVLRTGSALLYPEVTDAMLVATARDEAHLELMRQVGFRSAMIVPLRGHARLLGAITLVSAESGRRYTEADLAVAEDLGRRAGMAVDNARLFRDVERARADLERQAVELEAAAAELEAANEELQGRTTEAEEANRAKSEFLAMMSHELRTPLNAIAGYVELLQMGIHGPVTAAQHQSLRRIEASQRHLLGIIDDVLNFARLEAGEVRVELRDTPLDGVLEEVRAALEPPLGAGGLRYVQPAAPAPRVRADADKVRQILLNLLSNAVKFTPRGGSIRLDWEEGPGQVRLRVSDTGRGIPADKLESIFEPFVQLDAGLTREATGVGLGLSISRDLARAMDGDLSVESRPGEGSTFTLTLPAARP